MLADESRTRPPEDNPTATISHSIFYKFIEQSILLEKQLEIPRRFFEIYRDELRDVVYLMASTPDMWPVCLKRENQRVLFRGGWQKFVVDQSICAGCFLVFKYKGKSTFHVDVHNLASPEIKYPSIAPFTLEEFAGGKRFRLPHKNENLDDAVSIMDCQTFCNAPSFSLKNIYDDIYQTSWERVNDIGQSNSTTVFQEEHSTIILHRMPVATQDMIIQVEENELIEDNMKRTSKEVESHPFSQAKTHCGKRKAIAEPEFNEDELPTEDVLVVKPCTKVSSRSSPSRCKAERALAAAASCFKSNHPFVTVFMRPSYLSGRCRMNIPSWFAHKHLRGVSGDMKLQLHGKLWPVKFVFLSRYSYSGFTPKGWHTFVIDNHLKEGDACVFELVNTKDVVFKVTIFRSADFVA